MQYAPFCQVVHPDINNVSIYVFFGQSPPVAPILYNIQHRVQHFQVANLCYFPLSWKALLDLLTLSVYHRLVYVNSPYKMAALLSIYEHFLIYMAGKRFRALRVQMGQVRKKVPSITVYVHIIENFQCFGCVSDYMVEAVFFLLNCIL